MDNHVKLNIYKGIIQYLLTSTNYDLRDIADLSNAPIKNIRSIYYGKKMLLNPISEIRLVKTYHFILELRSHEYLSGFYHVGVRP